MSKKTAKQQDKLDKLKAQVAENRHPQQSSDPKKRLSDAQKAADKILIETTVTSGQE